MRTIIEHVSNGFIISEQREDFDQPEAKAIATDRVGIAGYFDDAIWARPTAQAVANSLVACFNHDQGISKKINMIKLVRQSTGAGLKEAKEAVEHAIAIRYSL